jgi:hypothetical protein
MPVRSDLRQSRLISFLLFALESLGLVHWHYSSIITRLFLVKIILSHCWHILSLSQQGNNDPPEPVYRWHPNYRGAYYVVMGIILGLT